MRTGISGHTQPFQGKSDDWITPKHILDALGEFDLDPCASRTQPWRTAIAQYTIDDDGFNRDWFGNVWANPPYGPETGKWMAKLAAHGNGVALIFARTETKIFFDSVWPHAHSLLFIKSRLYFHRPDGTRAPANAGGPSVLIAYGKECGEKLANSNIAGALISSPFRLIE